MGFDREALAVRRLRGITIRANSRQARSGVLDAIKDSRIPRPCGGRDRSMSSLLHGGALGLEVAREAATGGVDIVRKIRDVPRLTAVTRAPPANRSVEGVDLPRKLNTRCRQHRNCSIGINAVLASARSAQGIPVMASASATRTTRAISPRRVDPSHPARGAALPRPLAANPSRLPIGAGDGQGSSRH